MQVQPINTFNTTRYAKVSNTQTTKPANTGDNITFGYSSAYKSIFSSALSHDLEFGRHADDIFDMLKRGALSEGYVKNSKLMEILNRCKRLREMLFDFRLATRDVSEEIVSTYSGKPLIEACDTRLVFPDPISNDLSGTISFELDDKYDVVIERAFDKAKFYKNDHLKQLTKYTSDYSSSKTTYYNNDGSERSLRNFFSDFGI